MDMRRHECAHGERVLDDRQRAAAVPAVDLEHDTDARRQPAGAPASGLDDLELCH
jgi:hypothetical protein